MADFFNSKDLITDLPVMRAAYSDRTAWLMAELSRLVYEPLPGAATSQELVDDLREAIAQGEYEDLLEGFVKKQIRLRGKDYDTIPKALESVDFELLETFAEDDTEAMLVKLKHKGQTPFLVLVFRGTESFNDACTDAKAPLVPHPDGGRVHMGFLEAYDKVRKQINEAVAKHKGLPLYITGHSLGGALAMIATKELGAESTGATYTFGAPRAADDDFYIGIKTPIYRVVNAADCVARVPFGMGFNIVLGGIRLIPINYTKKISEWLRRYFSGYTHQGNLVFMNAPEKTCDDCGIDYKDLRVVCSPNYIWRASVVISQIIKSRGKAAATDHFIAGYCEKLCANAMRRR